jgi:hypothetical protein
LTLPRGASVLIDTREMRILFYENCNSTVYPIGLNAPKTGDIVNFHVAARGPIIVYFAMRSRPNWIAAQKLHASPFNFNPLAVFS